MKNVFGLLLIALTIQIVSIPSSHGKVNDAITKNEAVSLLYEWRDAYLNKDFDALHGIIDDTWLYSGAPDGSTTDKETAIAGFRKADYSYKKISYQDIDVRLFGSISVIRGTEELIIIGDKDGKEVIVNLRFTDVYQKIDGNVRAIATHTSPIAN